MNSSTYPTSFASPGRDSFVPVDSHAKGTVAWAKDLALDNPGGRAELLMSGPDLIVNSGLAFALFTPAGEKKWEIKKRPDGPVAVANSRIYYEAPGFFLEAVDASGTKLLAKGSYPGVASTEVQATLLWPREKDFVMTTYLGSPQYDEEDPGDANRERQIGGYRSLYGQALCEWAKRFSGAQTLPPLFVPEKNRWFISQQKVTSVDLGDGTKSSFTIPLDSCVSWSADAIGTLVVTGAHALKQTVVALTPDGKEQWRWVNPEATGFWVKGQPPARGPGGRVLALTQRQALAIENGKLLWTYDLADEALRAGATRNAAGALTGKDGHAVMLDQPAFATVLADGSILLAAGNGLRKLDSAGNRTFLVRAPSPIVAPPVVAPDGTIYLLTNAQIIRVD